MEQYYYSTSTEQTYSAYQMQSLFGINVGTAAVTTLNLLGFYPVVSSSPEFDVQLYTPLVSYLISGTNALMTWTAVPRDLSVAKVNGFDEAKAAAKQVNEIINAEYGLNAFSFAGIASQSAPPTRYQEVLDAITAVTDQLDVDLTAIDNATSVDEIDSILKHPSGTIMTGRGGAGPLDMQPSWFTVLDNLPPGVGEAELELYIPGTDTVIPYDAGLPEPYKFDSTGNCYTGTDFRTVIRVAATGQVISTVTPALGAQAPIEWTYNPDIPPAGGSSSSAF